MKFHDSLSVSLFLLEIGQPMDESNTVSFEPTPEMMEFFFKKRAKLVHKLIDFRKSRQQIANWKKNRWKYIKGIIKFHHSTEGKRFHRQLGDFLARNDFSGGFLRSSHESFINGEVGSILKVISSARTHAYIETEFYCSVDEQADYIIFLEEMMAATHQLEEKIYNMKPLDEEDIETMLNIIGKNNILFELKKKHSIPESDRNKIFELWEANYTEDEDNCLMQCYLKVDKMLVNIL